MKNIVLLLIILLVFPHYINSQTVVSGNLTVEIQTYINNLPGEGGDDYLLPSLEDSLTIYNTISAILNLDYSAANDSAAKFGYELLEYTDTDQSPSKVYYILDKKVESFNYWGMYIFNPAPERMRLFIQSPHPRFDTNTGRQGFHIFRNTGARGFFITGTHRCNSTVSTTCAGTTTVCNETNTSEPYKISDQAHSVRGILQIATAAASNTIENIIVIQPHGFIKTESDPDIILSCGTATSPAIDNAVLLQDALLLIDPTLTFKIPHLDTTWTRLTGTTNTQGRFINGSNNPCNRSANTSTGRFLHIEQAFAKLRDSVTNWNKLSNAIASVFTPEPLPVELSLFTAKAINEGILIEWRTSTEINNYGFYLEKSDDGTNFNSIAFISGAGTSYKENYYHFFDTKKGGNVFYRLLQIDNDGSIIHSHVVTVKPVAIINDFLLIGNYPNPFNPVTRIRFVIPYSAEIYGIVYNTFGEKVADLLKGEYEAGEHEIQFDGSGLASGIYYYSIIAGSNRKVSKFILLK